MKNIIIHGACIINLVSQKIRMLNTLANSLEEISNMLKKDFIYLSLKIKGVKKLWADFNGYKKAVSFTIHFRCFSYHKLLNLVNKVNQTKLNKYIVCNK